MMMDVVEISRRVLKRLCEMNYERKGGSSKERLIFPNKFPSETKKKHITEDELLKYNRISEQELRFLFVEEFLKESNNEYYYSVETPTEKKYKFGKTNDDIKIDASGRSASIDMCIFTKDSDNKYKRLLNIEFKNANASKKSISKDILKLMHEKEDGAFVLLLKNTDDGTLKSVFGKFSNSFDTHKKQWKGEKDKFIQLIILSLEVETNKNKTAFIKYRNVRECDLETIQNNIENEWI
jgi:hypothetical protein